MPHLYYKMIIKLKELLGVKLICNLQSSSKETVTRAAVLNPKVDILKCHKFVRGK